MNKYPIPEKPVAIAIYLAVEIFSSLSSIFNHITVKTGAELIIKVTKPEEIYLREKINDQPTRNIEKNPVKEASFICVLLIFPLSKIK